MKPGFMMPYVGGGVVTSFNSTGLTRSNGTVLSPGLDIEHGRLKFEKRENNVSKERTKQALQGQRVRTNSSKSSDSSRGGHASEPIAQVKSNARSGSGHRSPATPMMQSVSMGPPQSSGSMEPIPFSPPMNPSAVPSQIHQPQADYVQVISPTTYHSEDDAMVHYANSQGSVDYPANPPPSSHGMYEYEAQSSTSSHIHSAPSAQEYFDGQPIVYGQPEMSRYHAPIHHIPMQSAPPSLGLAIRPAGGDGSQPTAHLPTDPRLHRQQRRVEPQEPISAIPYDSSQAQHGWVDSRYSNSESQSWPPNYQQYWKPGGT